MWGSHALREMEDVVVVVVVADDLKGNLKVDCVSLLVRSIKRKLKVGTILQLQEKRLLTRCGV